MEAASYFLQNGIRHEPTRYGRRTVSVVWLLQRVTVSSSGWGEKRWVMRMTCAVPRGLGNAAVAGHLGFEGHKVLR